ncbi:excreted peptide [Streptococcus pneumoniae]|nr:excreted peptide [Streptococcus pneumoniae]
MTGTNTFTVLSTEDLEQTSGGLAVWEMDIVDGYIIENLLPI